MTVEVLYLTFPEICVNLPKESGWLRCPRCRKKIQPIRQDTEAKQLLVPCYKCKINWLTSIQKPAPKRPDITG